MDKHVVRTTFVLLMFVSIVSGWTIQYPSARLRDSLRVDSLKNAELLGTDANGKMKKVAFSEITIDTVRAAYKADTSLNSGKWGNHDFPSGEINNYVLTTDGAGTLSWSSKEGAGGGFVESINGSSAAAQTVSADNGLQVVDSGASSQVHKIRPAAGRIIPTGSGTTPDSSIKASISWLSYVANDADSLGGEIASEYIVRDELNDSLDKKLFISDTIPFARDADLNNYFTKTELTNGSTDLALDSVDLNKLTMTIAGTDTLMKLVTSDGSGNLVFKYGYSASRLRWDIIFNGISSGLSGNELKFLSDSTLYGFYINHLGDLVVVDESGSFNVVDSVKNRYTKAETRVLINDSITAHIPSTVTYTEIGYVDGVTSSIQTQLNSKLNLSDVDDTIGVYVSGTSGRIPKFTAASKIGNSYLKDSSSHIVVIDPGTTINASNWMNGWLRIGDGISIDDNEISMHGDNLFLETLDANDIYFLTNGSTARMIIKSSGKISLGNNPDPQTLVQVTGSSAGSIGTDWENGDDMLSLVNDDTYFNIVSTNEGTYGSGITLSEIGVADGLFDNSWNLIRKVITGGLYLRYGTSTSATSNSEIAYFTTVGGFHTTEDITAGDDLIATDALDVGGNAGIDGELNVGADIIAGTISTTSNRNIKSLAGDDYIASIMAYGSSQGTGFIYAGQSTTHGGWIGYWGDNSPTMPSGVIQDNICIGRRNNGTDYGVMNIYYGSNNVSFVGGISTGENIAINSNYRLDVDSIYNVTGIDNDTLIWQATTNPGYDIWNYIGYGAATTNYSWVWGYRGSTSGSGGNELMFKSTYTGAYLMIDHDGNLDIYNGSTSANLTVSDINDLTDGGTTTLHGHPSSEITGEVNHLSAFNASGNLDTIPIYFIASQDAIFVSSPGGAGVLDSFNIMSTACKLNFWPNSSSHAEFQPYSGGGLKIQADNILNLTANGSGNGILIDDDLIKFKDTTQFDAPIKFSPLVKTDPEFVKVDTFFITTMGGVGGTVQDTIRYQVWGRTITMLIPPMTGTSNANTLTLSVPVDLCPYGAFNPVATTFNAGGYVEDNGSVIDGVATCYCYPQGTNYLSFWLDNHATGWTSSGEKGFLGYITLTYMLY